MPTSSKKRKVMQKWAYSTWGPWLHVRGLYIINKTVKLHKTGCAPALCCPPVCSYSHCWIWQPFRLPSSAGEDHGQRRCSWQRHTPAMPKRQRQSNPWGKCQWPWHRGSWAESPLGGYWWWSWSAPWLYLQTSRCDGKEQLDRSIQQVCILREDRSYRKKFLYSLNSSHAVFITDNNLLLLLLHCKLGTFSANIKCILWRLQSRDLWAWILCVWVLLSVYRSWTGWSQSVLYFSLPSGCPLLVLALLSASLATLHWAVLLSFALHSQHAPHIYHTQHSFTCIHCWLKLRHLIVIFIIVCFKKYVWLRYFHVHTPHLLEPASWSLQIMIFAANIPTSSKVDLRP